MNRIETFFLATTFLMLIILFAQAFYIKKIKNRLQWFEDWGRKYVEKYREDARRDGLTK